MRHAVRSAILTFFFAINTFASITGTVMNGDGQPVSGAKVSAYALETVDARRVRVVSATPQRKALATATTDAKGSFRIDVPKEESFVDLRVDAAGYAPESSWNLAEDDAGAIVLTKAAMKSGTITANGKPVANASVFWIGGTTIDSFAVTDVNGHYSVPDPSKWAMRIVVVHPDYAMFSETAAVIRDASRISPDRTLTPGVKITGRVVGEDGTTPAAGAELFLDNWPAGKTGDDGTFTIAHARKDWQNIEARLGTRAARRVHADGAVTLKLAKAAAIGGTLVDAKTQRPVAGAYITVMPSGFGPMMNEVLHGAITDAKGAFSIPNVVPGNYALFINRPGYEIPRTEVALVAGRTVQKPLYGTPLGTISGVVVDEEKHPVAAAKVTTRAASRETMNFAMFGRAQGRDGVYSGPDGRFVDRNVSSEGDIIVDAVKKGYPPAHTTAFRVNAGEKKSGLSLIIPRGLAFSGRVLDKNNKPVAGAAIELSESTPDPAGGIRRMVALAMGRQSDDTVRSGADGTFTVRAKEGRYDVMVKAEGYAAKVLRAQTVAAGMKPVDVVLEPGVEISGRVTRGGVGVDNVMIMTVSMTEGSQSTTTAPDGTFRLGDLSPGPMMLVVSRQEAFIQEMRNVTAPAKDINIELPPGGRISGHVVDKASHQPVTSFQAGVSTARGGGGMVIQTPPMLKAFTSDDGAFTLENVRPGPTQVVVNAPGYTQGRVANIEVEEGKTAPDVTVELETGVKLTGKVTGQNGSPLSGVTVAVDQSPRAGRVMRIDPGNAGVVTDPNGEYTLEALEPGEKTFNYSRSGYVSEQRTVNLTGKEVRSDVQLSSGLRISGVVVTESGTPVPDALVRASSASDSMFGREARSDGNGNFLFEGLAPGHYNFNAAKSGYANGVTRDVDVSAGAPVRVTMKSGGVITGHVSGLTAEELGMTNVTASASGAGIVSSAVDAGGNYRIEGAPTGTVRVSARVGGPMFSGGSKTSEPKTVVLDPGGSATADIEFKSTTVVRGRVTRAGRPMQNAMVAFYPRGGRAQTSASATADGNGYYEVNGIADGPYNVQVLDFDRLSPFATTYEVKGSGTFDIDIKVSSVRGRVVDATNDQPLADARVEIRAKDGASMFNSRTAITDAGGNFIVDAMAKGTYQISADKDNFGQTLKDLVVEDTPAEVELKLSPSAGIVLRVVDGRDGRLIAASPHVVDSQGVSRDEGFRFSFTPEPIRINVSPGTYRVVLTANGYATKTIMVTAPASQTVAMTPGGTLLIKSKSTSTDLRVRLIGGDGQIYALNNFNQGAWPLVASPGVTTFQNVAAGTYRVEVLDKSDRVVNSTSVTVAEGQATTIEI